MERWMATLCSNNRHLNSKHSRIKVDRDSWVSVLASCGCRIAESSWTNGTDFQIPCIFRSSSRCLPVLLWYLTSFIFTAHTLVELVPSLWFLHSRGELRAQLWSSGQPPQWLFQVLQCLIPDCHSFQILYVVGVRRLQFLFIMYGSVCQTKAFDRI